MSVPDLSCSCPIQMTPSSRSSLHESRRQPRKWQVLFRKPRMSLHKHPRHNVKFATMRAVLRRTYQAPRPPRWQYRTFASASDSSPIKVKYQPAPHSGNIRILLLDRPEARNALSRRLVDDLKRHVNEVQAEGGTGSTRALIIASKTDKAFCAGADLRERKGMTQEE